MCDFVKAPHAIRCPMGGRTLSRNGSAALLWRTLAKAALNKLVDAMLRRASLCETFACCGGLGRQRVGRAQLLVQRRAAVRQRRSTHDAAGIANWCVRGWRRAEGGWNDAW